VQAAPDDQHINLRFTQEYASTSESTKSVEQTIGPQPQSDQLKEQTAVAGRSVYSKSLSSSHSVTSQCFSRDDGASGRAHPSAVSRPTAIYNELYKPLSISTLSVVEPVIPSPSMSNSHSVTKQSPISDDWDRESTQTLKVTAELSASILKDDGHSYSAAVFNEPLELSHMDYPQEADLIDVPSSRSIRLGDRDELDKFYHQTFHCIQQLTLKSLMKAWLKVIIPGRQRMAPYTKHHRPEFWPMDCQYKEPDHLKKQG
jgi:hypothetical protein